MITLSKSSEPAELGSTDASGNYVGVTRLDVGISWDKSTQQAGGSLIGKLQARANKQKGVDLDLVAILCQGGEPVRYAGMEVTDPMKDGSVIHTGDNTTGEGEGDDEQIICNLTKIRANIDTIVFCAGAFKPKTALGAADNVSFTVYDASDGRPEAVAEIMPSLLGTGNACAIAKAYRHDGGWKFEVINEMGSVTQGDFKSLLRFGMNR